MWNENLPARMNPIKTKPVKSVGAIISSSLSHGRSQLVNKWIDIKCKKLKEISKNKVRAQENDSRSATPARLQLRGLCLCMNRPNGRTRGGVRLLFSPILLSLPNEDEGKWKRENERAR